MHPATRPASRPDTANLVLTQAALISGHAAVPLLRIAPPADTLSIDRPDLPTEFRQASPGRSALPAQSRAVRDSRKTPENNMIPHAKCQSRDWTGPADEAVNEMLAANGYTFTADGERFG